MIAKEIQTAVCEKCAALKASSRPLPKLVSVIAGTCDGSEIYIKAQTQAAANTGIVFETCKLSGSVTQSELMKKIGALNVDPSVTAVIIQHPLPAGIDHDKVISAINPEKDAEGTHPCNLGRIFRREADIVPCTPGAVMKILSYHKIDLYGKDVVIIGHSPIVGKPLSLMMLNETATTSVCHIGTAKIGHIQDYTRRADILVVAVGKSEMVKSDWIKEGAIVIDVGINNVAGKITGDVDFNGVKDKASLITPVPGGVGPITVAILMRNVLRAYRTQHENI